MLHVYSGQGNDKIRHRLNDEELLEKRLKVKICSYN